MRDFRTRADEIAADRAHGASELVAALLPVLDAAMAEGGDATADVARRVCSGQPAMAPLWNICAAALADAHTPGRYARVRAEVERAPRALVRAAVAALRDALRDVAMPRLLTLSYSGSVARTLTALAAELPVQTVCAESRPGQEGKRLHDEFRRSGIQSELIEDALLTTYLSSAAGVVVGADAVSSTYWTNKAGTYGLSAAAWFSGVPVYVVATRDKAEAASLTPHLSSTGLFERTPVQLVTLFLTETGPVPPDGVTALAERWAPDLEHLFRALR